MAAVRSSTQRTRASRLVSVPAGADTVSTAVDGAQLKLLESIESRVLWLAVRMIHEANVVRPNPDGLKVGGHQASTASMVSLLTALSLHWLRPDDLVAVKPHAGPAMHALNYLMGTLDRSYLTTLRSFGGLQSYPSRTKDPDRVDFSTGSVGLGAVAPLFAALADQYLRAHFADEARRWPSRRFVATVGDAELDEGNVWEAALEDPLQGLGNVTFIVDLNRQSLDRVVPGIRIRRLELMFRSAGWHVLEAKYGRRLERAFAGRGGEALRARIDGMPNEEYQGLIRRPGAEVRERLISGALPDERDAVAQSLSGTDDDALPVLLSDLGGHDMQRIIETLDAADAQRDRPTVLFAYTIKGYRLPFAGDPLNHSAMLNADQVQALAPALGVDPDDPWGAFPDDSPEGRLCAERGAYLRSAGPRRRGAVAELSELPIPADLDVRIANRTSTQQVLGDTLASLARVEPLASRIVTASPDVSVSTSLGGWINRVGVYAPTEQPVLDDAPRLLRWAPAPSGRHIELGISEMDLFMWLGQFGLTAELFDEPLIPIGTVYDPFIARGLDALIHSLYSGSRFILVATPSGVSLAPEGGAHQSSITPSIGIELPSLHAWEPAFGLEAAWCLLEGVRGCLDQTDGFSTYLRLTTRLVDQTLASPVRERLGLAEWRRQALAGGYRLLEARELAPDLPADAPTMTVVATGAVVPEAADAVRFLATEEVAASLIVVTSPDRLAAEMHDRRLAAIRHTQGADLPHLSLLFPPAIRRDPIVTVVDGASHSLGFLGAAFGAPVVPLGMDRFGQSGTIGDLYAYAGIDAGHIIEAALLALEIQ